MLYDRVVKSNQRHTEVNRTNLVFLQKKRREIQSRVLTVPLFRNLIMILIKER